ncbi:MAG: hypothetical protein ABIS69_08270, partial [Sediminibacterium sp.]
RVVALSPYAYSYYKDSIVTPLGTTGMRVIDSFYSFSKLNIISPRKLEVTDGIIKNCVLQFSSEKTYLKMFQSARLNTATVQLVIVKDDQETAQFPTNIRLSDIIKTEQLFVTSFKVSLPSGIYLARFSLPTAIFIDPTLNSTFVKLIVP